MKLNCFDRSNGVRSKTKTRLDNDVINCVSVVYAKIETELLGPIGQDVIYHEKQIGQ